MHYAGKHEIRYPIEIGATGGAPKCRFIDQRSIDHSTPWKTTMGRTDRLFHRQGRERISSCRDASQPRVTRLLPEAFTCLSSRGCKLDRYRNARSTRGRTRFARGKRKRQIKSERERTRRSPVFSGTRSNNDNGELSSMLEAHG